MEPTMVNTDDGLRSIRNDGDVRGRHGNAARKCADMMKMARNDTDRIAALAMIPKLMQGQTKSKPGDQGMLMISESIPIDFIERLLESKQDCGHILAIRVLACLLTSEDVVQSARFVSLGSRIIELTYELCSTSEDESIMDDALFCCARFGASITFAKDLFRLLIELVKTKKIDPIIDAAFYSYGRICTLEEEKLEPGNFALVQTYMDDFLNVLLKRIRSDQTLLHFEMLSQLCGRLDSFNHYQDHNVAVDGASPALLKCGTWICDLRTIIGNLLKSRCIGDKERRIALDLACTMSLTFHSAWFDGDTTFLQLLANMVSIDVRISLENDRKACLDNITELPLANAPYVAECQFLEMVIELAASCGDSNTMVVNNQCLHQVEPIELTEQQALQINRTLLELTNFLLNYLSLMEETTIKFSVYPLYRFVCAYLAQGLILVQMDLLTTAAKPLLRLCERAMNEKNETGLGMDAMGLLLPALSELIEAGDEWNGVKKTFKDYGVVKLMERYKNSADDHYEDVFKSWVAF